jgi:protein gp37
MADTSIEWTDKVWNPVTGCSKVSQGCKHCYAETIANRFWGERKFTDVQCHPERLDEPSKWRKPAKVFVNSMSDLFHEDVPDKFIDQVFAMMYRAKQHTFQVLTKRPARMLEYFRRFEIGKNNIIGHDVDRVDRIGYAAGETYGSSNLFLPLPNVWLGVSVENQRAADERIPLLLQTPAAVRFVSCEPLLGAIDLEPFYLDNIHGGLSLYLDWLIVGGESGAGARPMQESWVRSIVQQCQAASVPVFVKQMGSVWAKERYIPTKSKKGGDIQDFPVDLQIREFPQ